MPINSSSSDARSSNKKSFTSWAVARRFLHSRLPGDTVRLQHRKHCINYFLWMNFAGIAGEARNRELNKHLCATERHVFLSVVASNFKWRRKAQMLYRTTFINELLAMKYRRLIANWKLKTVFPLALDKFSEAVLLCMEFRWV